MSDLTGLLVDDEGIGEARYSTSERQYLHNAQAP